MRHKGKIGILALLLAAGTVFAGCSKPAVKEPDSTTAQTVSEESEAESTEEDGDLKAGETKGPGVGDTKENETDAENTDSETEEETGAEEDDAFVQQKIVIATDVHYLAEELAGNRCTSFMTMTKNGDGRVLQYGWEVLDAFLDDMVEEKPDLVILSGDLTLNGEKKSHEELADKLEVLLDHDIEVAVIPGNHDINNPQARRFFDNGSEKTDTVTAAEFAGIYADFGYVAADSRDPASLSYLYKLDDYYWLLMLDSCQYDPVNEIGGMIRSETYEWMEKVLEEAWEEGAQVISVSHHNLLDQSGVSQEFYDNCTIEHNEELVELLSDYDVRLHLSGHLHLQHYKEDENTGIYEVVTGSMVMAPCQYGVLKIWNDGTYQYDGASVDVDGWAKRNSYKNRELADFKSYSEHFLGQVAYTNAVRDLRKHILDRKVFFSDERINEMAEFYAKLCIYYYGGRMYEIAEEISSEPAYEYWKKIDYLSELSDFLKNILEDEPKDFAHLKLLY